MPTSSTINKKTENNENEVQADLGANIVLIGAPGSGKLGFLLSIINYS
jgi:hypothetical protein